MSGNIQGLTLSSNSSRKAEATSSVVTALLPIMSAVFVAFLVTGLAMLGGLRRSRKSVVGY